MIICHSILQGPVLPPYFGHRCLTYHTNNIWIANGLKHLCPLDTYLSFIPHICLWNGEKPSRLKGLSTHWLSTWKRTFKLSLVLMLKGRHAELGRKASCVNYPSPNDHSLPSPPSVTQLEVLTKLLYPSLVIKQKLMFCPFTFRKLSRVRWKWDTFLCTQPKALC